ncbi:hypothetical protein SeLEV6574_g06677 [Synchytrium endobioticum]|uniref:Uncharacterized protein n=1 Tax=Synchytrium endobioticum TaxID=286115 RepID=A0A507CMU1_9FUNG|nr:hypothetical protein SeLEV6574_g06677 [Synchytrium endobioticum]
MDRFSPNGTTGDFAGKFGKTHNPNAKYEIHPGKPHLNKVCWGQCSELTLKCSRRPKVNSSAEDTSSGDSNSNKQQKKAGNLASL